MCPNWFTDSSESLSKIQQAYFFFCKNWKIEGKIHLEIKGPRIAKTILENNNKMEGLPKTDKY